MDRLTPFADLQGTILLTLSPAGELSMTLSMLDVETGVVSPVPSSGGFVLMNGSYSPDGRSLAYIGSRTGALNLQVYVRDLEKKETRTITSSTSTSVSLINSKRLPEWSPEGTRIAYSAQNIQQPGEWIHEDIDRWVVLLADLSGNETIVTSSAYQPKWLPSGDALLVLKKDGVYRVGLSDKVETTIVDLGREVSIFTKMDLSDDGKRLAVTHREAKKIDIYDIVGENPLTVTHRKEISGDARDVFWPTFSPDGNYLVAQWVDHASGEISVIAYNMAQFQSRVVARLTGYNPDVVSVTDWR
jgi:Tol biopolymer transport system component